MTRETKIGLLVGLAFIIVIGILLSDQLMRATEAPAAPLSNVGDTLRKGTTTPASRNRPAAVVTSAEDASPESAVPTKEEITRRPPPVTFVEIRPGGPNGAPIQNNAPAGNGGGTNVAIGSGQQANTTGQIPLPLQARGVIDTGPAMPPVTGGNTNAGNRGTGGMTIADVAARMGETLVGPDGQPLRASRPIGSNGPNVQVGNAQRTAAQTGMAGMKQYTVEPGDSLSRIALRQMGANSQANRDAIVRANPSLQADPDRVVIGRTYNIPLTAGGNAQAQTPAPDKTAQPRQVEKTPAPAPIKASGGEFWYQVQPGDNLWKIAKDQLGDASTVPAIKELNKDSVKNWNVLPAGTKLRLPARPVASVQ
jgi:nucleoid-associated protein YgaU